ncbi:hypothetical protein DFH09DRAFT_1312183 [Mycena vulgaris]|nr:hypothetical protein DFH09DRAFT_1312183 [Mycena vulgaris]
MSTSLKRIRRMSIPIFISIPIPFVSHRDSDSSTSPPICASLPTPVSPKSLSMETPSLGSNEILPRPKCGAPPVAPAIAAAERRRSFRQSLKLGGVKSGLDPALCEEWK